MGANGNLSYVDQGIMLLREQGMWDGPLPFIGPEPEVAEPEEATEAEVLGALVAQLQAMTDRIAAMETQAQINMQRLADAVAQVAELVTAPRRRVPIRDSAGRITETWETVEPHAGL